MYLRRRVLRGGKKFDFTRESKDERFTWFQSILKKRKESESESEEVLDGLYKTKKYEYGHGYHLQSIRLTHFTLSFRNNE